MTLDEMCFAAARYSDRYDEYEKTLEGGFSNKAEDWFEDDALHYFTVFRDAINEAYRNVSRARTMPDTYIRVPVTRDRQVELADLSPGVFTVKGVFKEDRSAAIPYTFYTKYVLNVDAEPGTYILLYYHYVPDDLEFLDDEPIFPESQVDSMLYICLAVARIWQSEKKFDYANQWLRQYYDMLRDIRSSMRSLSPRRIPRGIFR